MGVLVWVSDLDTGIEEIDQQHRRILDYINQLYGLLNTDDRASVGRVIDETIDYTLSHFVFEETMLESAGYMFVGPHRKVHDIFTRRVAGLHQRFLAGEDVTAELHGLLSRWLFNHIRTEDRAYIDSARAYMKMMRSATKPEPIQDQEQRRRKKEGWLARLFTR